MSKTTILWVVLFAGGLALSIVHPIWALTAYLVDYYQHPPLRWWGRELPAGFRWSLTASLVLLASLFVTGRSPFSASITRHAATRWLLGLCAIGLAVTPIAVSPERSLHYVRQLFIFTITYMAIAATLDSRKHWRWMVTVMALGSFTWGWDSWLDPSREAGRLLSVGGPDSFNDNSAAIHLLAVLPLLLVMITYGGRVERAIGLISTPFTINTIILCNSRGSTVALIVMSVTALVLARGRLRLRIAGLLLAGAAATFALSDWDFIERQLTLFSSERDTSASSRIESWKGAIELMKDYPLGAGGGGFDILSPQYIPEIVERAGEERAVHNTYLWIGSDYGFAGLFCFLMYMASTFAVLQKRRRQLGSGREAVECLAMQVALAGIWTGGFFVNRVYGEAMYWLPAMAIALSNVTADLVTAGATSAEASDAPGTPPPARVAQETRQWDAPLS